MYAFCMFFFLIYILCEIWAYWTWSFVDYDFSRPSGGNRVLRKKSSTSQFWIKTSAQDQNYRIVISNHSAKFPLTKIGSVDCTHSFIELPISKALFFIVKKYEDKN